MRACVALTALWYAHALPVGVWAQTSTAEPAPDSTFLLVSEDPTRTPSPFLGNGRLGVVIPALGVGASNSFLAGLYEEAPGDVPRIVAVPAWNAIAIFDGQRWLLGGRGGAGRARHAGFVAASQLSEPPQGAVLDAVGDSDQRFVTGAGGFPQQVIFGWTGLRLGEHGLEPAFPPLLPSHITRLALRNIQVRGRRYDVVIDSTGRRMIPGDSLPR